MSTDASTAASWVHQHLSGWPEARRKLAATLVAKYGPPQEATARELIWGEKVPWKRMVLHRAGVKHNFPFPHEDVLEQTVNYRVPPEKASDLIKYNGSLVIDSTRGELSCHCDSEPQNTIALNIADDIVTGNRTVDEGAAYHAQMIRALQTHVAEAYPRTLKFKFLPSSQTEDPGEEAPLLEHLGE
ncbi:MAG TPA: hypothetical protein VMU40_21735 [Steroidobacteraceae bacterium]|nr:hypothetical protein [Steroidobacteraceae bacterium]